MTNPKLQRLMNMFLAAHGLEKIVTNERAHTCSTWQISVGHYESKAKKEANLIHAITHRKTGMAHHDAPFYLEMIRFRKQWLRFRRGVIDDGLLAFTPSAAEAAEYLELVKEYGNRNLVRS